MNIVTNTAPFYVVSLWTIRTLEDDYVHVAEEVKPMTHALMVNMTDKHLCIYINYN
jgi:hypothetical protein